MLSQLIDSLETLVPGLYNFDGFADACFQAAAQDAEHAAFYLLLGVDASQFVLAHDGPQSPTTVEAEKRRLLEYGKMYQAAQVGDNAKKLAALNNIAQSMLSPPVPLISP